LTELK